MLIRWLDALQMLYACMHIILCDEVHSPSAQLHSSCTTGTEPRRAAAGCPMSLQCSHGYLLHGNNHPFVVLMHGTPRATNRGKYASALFSQQWLWAAVSVCVYLSVFVCKCVHAREGKRATPPTLTSLSVRTQ